MGHRLRRFVLPALIAALACVPVTVWLQQGTASPESVPESRAYQRPFIINIDPPDRAESCEVRSFPAGASGQFAGAHFVGSDIGSVKRAGRGAFAIPTGVGGKPAMSLKVAMWCPRSAIEVINEPALESSTFSRTIRLQPLKEVALTGRLHPDADGPDLAGASLTVFYLADWLSSFSNRIDGAVPMWPVATGRVSGTGTFSVLIPDFANDAVVMTPVPGGTAEPGAFLVRATRKTAPFDFTLVLEGGFMGLIPVAATYPSLTLRPRGH